MCDMLENIRIMDQTKLIKEVDTFILGVAAYLLQQNCLWALKELTISTQYLGKTARWSYSGFSYEIENYRDLQRNCQVSLMLTTRDNRELEFRKVISHVEGAILIGGANLTFSEYWEYLLPLVGEWINENIQQ